MPVRKHNAPPGLDYDPITGEEQNISYGVVGADGIGADLHRAGGVAFDRIHRLLRGLLQRKQGVGAADKRQSLHSAPQGPSGGSVFCREKPYSSSGNQSWILLQIARA